MLPLAIIAITAALVFYTAGVWTEHKQKLLKPWHLTLFGTGFFFDSLGTWMMSQLSKTSTGERNMLTEVMAITGLIALILMALHLAWAVWTCYKGTERQKAQFHKFSVVVWAIWLIPYFAGAVGAMA